MWHRGRNNIKYQSFPLLAVTPYCVSSAIAAHQISTNPDLIISTHTSLHSSVITLAIFSTIGDEKEGKRRKLTRLRNLMMTLSVISMYCIVIKRGEKRMFRARAVYA